jgi:hypothetical protein
VLKIFGFTRLAFGRDGEMDYLFLILGFIFAAFAALPTLIFLAGAVGSARRVQNTADFPAS